MNSIYIIWWFSTLLWFCGGGEEEEVDVEMCWNIKQSTMFEICSTTRKCYGEKTTRRRKRIDDGQLAFLCESTAKGDITISEHWIAFYWNVYQSFSRRFNREFKLEHFCIPHFSDGFDHESEIPSISQIKIFILQHQSANTEIPFRCCCKRAGSYFTCG